MHRIVEEAPFSPRPPHGVQEGCRAHGIVGGGPLLSQATPPGPDECSLSGHSALHSCLDMAGACKDDRVSPEWYEAQSRREEPQPEGVGSPQVLGCSGSRSRWWTGCNAAGGSL